MITIATILKLTLSLGFTISVQPVDTLEYTVQYYNQNTNMVYQCNMVDSDIGKLSVCQTSENTGTVFVLTSKVN